MYIIYYMYIIHYIIYYKYCNIHIYYINIFLLIKVVPEINAAPFYTQIKISSTL